MKRQQEIAESEKELKPKVKGRSSVARWLESRNKGKSRK